MHMQRNTGIAKLPHPNIFEFATKELSQDAFVCWLVAWAKSEYEDANPKLHKLGIAFVKLLLGKQQLETPDKFEEIDILTQNGGIDVLVIINEKFAIIIEDKTDTIEHSSQLTRYTDHVKAGKYGRGGENIPIERISRIYLKTGDQGSYENVKNAGYEVLLRYEFMSFLQMETNWRRASISRRFF